MVDATQRSSWRYPPFLHTPNLDDRHTSPRRELDFFDFIFPSVRPSISPSLLFRHRFAALGTIIVILLLVELPSVGMSVRNVGKTAFVAPCATESKRAFVSTNVEIRFACFTGGTALTGKCNSLHPYKARRSSTPDRPKFHTIVACILGDLC
jgi:hypothetical protein